METTMKSWMRILVVGLLSFSAGGCAAFRASTTDVNVDDKKHYDAKFDYTDMRNITDSVAGELAGSSFLSGKGEPPVMMIAGVQNRTTQHVDTKSLTDRIRTMLLQQNKVRFVNDARREDLLKEQGYQAAHATPETQAAVGRQLGAQYMLSGSLSEMKAKSPDQVRVSRQELRYYKLTMEVTDLVSSEIVWTTEKEFAREASKPLIGW